MQPKNPYATASMYLRDSPELFGSACMEVIPAAASP